MNLKSAIPTNPNLKLGVVVAPRMERPVGARDAGVGHWSGASQRLVTAGNGAKKKPPEILKAFL